MVQFGELVYCICAILCIVVYICIGVCTCVCYACMHVTGLHSMHGGVAQCCIQVVHDSSVCLCYLKGRPGDPGPRGAPGSPGERVSVFLRVVCCSVGSVGTSHKTAHCYCPVGYHLTAGSNWSAGVEGTSRAKGAFTATYAEVGGVFFIVCALVCLCNSRDLLVCRGLQGLWECLDIRYQRHTHILYLYELVQACVYMCVCTDSTHACYVKCAILY